MTNTPQLLNPANLYSILGADSENHIHIAQKLVVSCTTGVQNGQKWQNIPKSFFFGFYLWAPKNVTHTLQPLNHSHFDSIPGADSENNIHTSQRLVVSCTVGVQKWLKWQNVALNPANSYCILGADSDYHIHTVQQLVISCTVGVQREQKCKNMYKNPSFWCYVWAL